MSLFDSWMRELERRHLENLRFAEVSRALRALSSAYVERRQRIHEGRALSGAGKRAAFALFYGPLHYVTVRAAVRGRLAHVAGPLVDLGCGTGAAGAAWAEVAAGLDGVVGIDRNAWALAEAARTYRHFGLRARTYRGDMARAPWPTGRASFVAAYSVNEASDADREHLLQRLLERAGRGDAVLIVEPLARGVAPWWGRWRSAFEGAGGRADEWRARLDLPDIVRKLDRAAGLDHRELTARTLMVGMTPGSRSA